MILCSFEQQSIENNLKIESWERFLSRWIGKNPYSEQDTALRTKARSQLSYWQNEIQQQDASVVDSKAAKKLLKFKRCRECDLTRADLTRANLRSADLTGADLTGASLWRADLRNADLRGAYLNGATGTGLTGADLTGARFCKTTMPDGTIRNDDC